MKEVVDYIIKNDIGRILKDEPISKHTTYGVGGTSKIMVFPKDTEKLKMLLKKIKEENIKYKVLGNGSNVIFSDNEYDGVIIKLDNFNGIKIDKDVINVEAGFSLPKLSLIALDNGLTGLEFASGIPACVAGAVFMNAGAYNSDMSSIVKEIKVLTPSLEVKTLSNKDLCFKYRNSFLKQNPGYICLEATLELKKGNKEEIRKVMETRKKRRLMTQPLEYKSAGSVFRNPPNDFAGRLIEDCKLKGYKKKDAQVSEKHANFIINKAHATANDIKSLIDYVHDTVKEKTGIDLLIEQEFVNWE